MTSSVDPVAAAGFGEGKGDAYDTYRPAYPDAALDYLRSSLPKPEGPLNVLELGAGTGIFTRCLLKHKELGPAIGSLHAVEPSAGMRDTFEKKVLDERVSCREGTFDQTGAEDGWADLAISAQAWHWCQDYEVALREMARVLKPDGILALTWNNVTFAPETETEASMGTALNAVRAKMLASVDVWRKMFSVPAYEEFFQHQVEHTVDFGVPTTVEGSAQALTTISFVATLPEEKKQELREQITDTLNKLEGRKWIDEEKGIWDHPYTNIMVVIRKK